MYAIKLSGVVNGWLVGWKWECNRAFPQVSLVGPRKYHCDDCDEQMALLNEANWDGIKGNVEAV